MSYLFEGTTLANGQTCSGNKSIGARQYAWGGNSGSDTTRFIYGTYHSVRIYNAPLTEDQLAWNRVIDEVRFRGFVTNGVVVVASNIGVVGGNGGERNVLRERQPHIYRAGKRDSRQHNVRTAGLHAGALRRLHPDVGQRGHVF